MEYITTSKTNKAISMIKDALKTIDANCSKNAVSSSRRTLTGEALENIASFIQSFVGLAAIALLNGGVNVPHTEATSVKAMERLFVKYDISKQVLMSLESSNAKETYIIK